jgi:hypothetical protein
MNVKIIVLQRDKKNFSFAIFPNPVSDKLSIIYIGLLKEEIDVKLFDINGRLLRQARIYPG